MSKLTHDEFLALLEQDVRTSLGESFIPIVRAHATNIATFQFPPEFDKIAEDVQQEILDNHVRTVWPPCPVHPHHPLWFENDAWRCPQDATIFVAPGKIGR